MKPFKQEFTFDERLQESAAMIANYLARIPVIVERFSRSNLPQMEKRKYLVPCDMPVRQFISILRSRLHLSPGTALFVFVNNTLPQTASLMGSVYDSYKDKESKTASFTCATAARRHLADLVVDLACSRNCLCFAAR